MSKEKICYAKKTSIGGQALIEGIMMRGPHMTAMAVRDPDGNIVLEKNENSTKKPAKILTLPIIRGVYGMITSLTLGYKCLMRSAEIAGLEDEEPKKDNKTEAVPAADPESTPATETTETTAEVVKPVAEAAEPATPGKASIRAADDTAQKGESGTKTLLNVVMVIGIVLGVALSIALFIYLPKLLFNAIRPLFGIVKPDPTAPYGDRYLYQMIVSAFTGVLKIAIFVIYMACVSLMKDIKRTFMYHGAEHKTIFCYEQGLPLTVENIRIQSRFHPRCGTSFLIVMLLISIIIGFFVPLCADWLYVLIKLALVPFAMGIGYEFIKFAGRHDNLLVRILSAPGLWMQRISTKEPTDDMIECAIAAMNEVIPSDGSDSLT